MILFAKLTMVHLGKLGDRIGYVVEGESGIAA